MSESPASEPRPTAEPTAAPASAAPAASLQAPASGPAPVRPPSRTLEPLTSPPMTRRFIGWEIVIVLALSLGRSGVNSLINLIDLASRAPIAQGQASLNGSVSARPWIDLAYQLSGIVFSLAPVALVLWMLWRWPGGNPFRRLGLDGAAPWRDAWQGAALFLVIGAGTLGVYAGGRALGITTSISTSGLGEYWWTIPVLLLAALRNGLLEEVIVIGYLFDRLRRLGWNTLSIVLTAAVLRGSYHLYQGIGPFIGNAIMGVIFGYFYVKTKRVAPLVIAHFLLDAVGFVGYPLLASAFGYGS